MLWRQEPIAPVEVVQGTGELLVARVEESKRLGERNAPVRERPLQRWIYDLLSAHGLDVEREAPLPVQRSRAGGRGTLRVDFRIDAQNGPACYVELKVVGEREAGVWNPRYREVLTRGLHADAVKLSCDPAVGHAAILLVVFSRDASRAAYDVLHAQHLLLDAGLPVGLPLLRTWPYFDGLGHEALVVGWLPVGRRPPVDAPRRW